MQLKSRPILRVLRTSICGVGLIAVSSLPITVQADPNHGSVLEGGRFTPNSNGAVFPPQPRSAENIRNFEQTPAPSSRARNQLIASIVADNRVNGALGDRYAFLGSTTLKTKWSGSNERQQVTFFSHSWNQTVVVTHQDNAISDIILTPANEDQPALGEPEKIEAIEIARSHWLSEGNPLIAPLIGYAIQTFQDDGSPFPTRMVYVSFHIESPEPPLLANWVDLTTQQVVRSEIAE